MHSFRHFDAIEVFWRKAMALNAQLSLDARGRLAKNSLGLVLRGFQVVDDGLWKWFTLCLLLFTRVTRRDLSFSPWATAAPPEEVQVLCRGLK